MKINRNNFPKLLVISSLLFIAWGGTGHYIINYNSIYSALPTMIFFNEWADSLAAHASDADYRKQYDPTEGPKHYIDIDNYPSFLAGGTIPQSFDSCVTLYGYSFVIQQGILPWAILQTFDSVQTAFETGRYHQAMLFSADLGHYVADAHMPLHLTRNYNGQYSGQYGVHSRFESTMINYFSSQIIYGGENLDYIENPSDYIFNMIYYNYTFVDSVLYADNVAASFAGNTTSYEYYLKMWELSSNFTVKLFKNASNILADLIYTAWLNAGSPTTYTENINAGFPYEIKLYQNFPNPFNPSTKIRFYVSGKDPHKTSRVSLTVYDLTGREISVLVNDDISPGDHTVEFNESQLHNRLATGVYFYTLRIENYTVTKKMLLLK